MFSSGFFFFFPCLFAAAFLLGSFFSFFFEFFPIEVTKNPFVINGFFFGLRSASATAFFGVEFDFWFGLFGFVGSKFFGGGVRFAGSSAVRHRGSVWFVHPG